MFHTPTALSLCPSYPFLPFLPSFSRNVHAKEGRPQVSFTIGHCERLSTRREGLNEQVSQSSNHRLTYLESSRNACIVDCYRRRSKRSFLTTRFLSCGGIRLQTGAFKHVTLALCTASFPSFPWDLYLASEVLFVNYYVMFLSQAQALQLITTTRNIYFFIRQLRSAHCVKWYVGALELT
jgi:hypothetical protein